MPQYFPHVDGLRALAVLAVIAYHLHPSLLPGGFAGVDLFFVISGFVVTASLAGHRGESLVSFLGRFYARRLARIAPALLAMLMATTVAYVFLVPRAWLSGITESVGKAAFWGFSNWTLGAQSETYFAPRAEFNPYLHTWSLGVEEQFYLVAPLLLFGWVRWRGESGRRKYVAVAAMAILALASLAACIGAASFYGPQYVFYALLFRFWELAVGVLWFQWAAGRSDPSPKIGHYWSWASWVGIVVTALTLALANAQSFSWPWALGAVIGAVLLIGDPRAPSSDPVRRFFAMPGRVWIGQRSYSLYLWHWPVFVLFRWTVGLETWPTRFMALSLAMLLAMGSFRWIERPVRGSAALKRVAAGWRVAGFLLVTALAFVGARELLDKQPRLGLSAVTRNANDWYVTERMKHGPQSARQCEPRIVRRGLSDVDVIDYLPNSCAVRSGPHLFVLGDSHATAYLPMFDQLSAEQGRVVRVYHIPGCPYIDLLRPMGHSRGPECLRGARAAMKDVLELAHTGDVVFLPSLRVPRLVDEWGRSKAEKALHGDSDFRRSPHETPLLIAAIDDAPQWFAPFQTAGLHVVFAAPPPIFRVPVFRCTDWFNRVNPQCAEGLSEARTDEEIYRAPTLDALRSLALRHPGIRIWDPLPSLCSGDRCNAFHDEVPLFFDADHVSAYGNFVLFPSFKQALKALENP